MGIKQQLNDSDTNKIKGGSGPPFSFGLSAILSYINVMDTIKHIIPVVLAAALLAGVGCGSGGSFTPQWQIDLGAVRSCEVLPAGDTTVVLLNGDRLMALDINTGDTIWEKELDADVASSVELHLGTVLVGDKEGRLTAYDLETGDDEWELDIGERFRSGLTVKDDIIYCGAGESIFAIDPVSREVKWSRSFGPNAPVSAMPVVEGDLLYVQVLEHIYALDTASGKEIWSYETCRYSGERYGEPVAILQGKVLTGTPTGYFIALDADDGELLWKYDATEGFWNDRLSVKPYATSGKVVFGFDAIQTLEESEEGALQ